MVFQEAFHFTFLKTWECYDDDDDDDSYLIWPLELLMISCEPSSTFKWRTQWTSSSSVRTENIMGNSQNDSICRMANETDTRTVTVSPKEKCIKMYDTSPIYGSGFINKSDVFSSSWSPAKTTCDWVASIESNMLKGSNLILWDDGTCQ